MSEHETVTPIVGRRPPREPALKFLVTKTERGRLSPKIRPGIVVVLKAGCLRAAVSACAARAVFSAVIAVAVVIRRELLRMILPASRRCDDGSEIFDRLGTI